MRAVWICSITRDALTRRLHSTRLVAMANKAGRSYRAPNAHPPFRAPVGEHLLSLDSCSTCRDMICRPRGHARQHWLAVLAALACVFLPLGGAMMDSAAGGLSARTSLRMRTLLTATTTGASADCKGDMCFGCRACTAARTVAGPRAHAGHICHWACLLKHMLRQHPGLCLYTYYVLFVCSCSSVDARVCQFV